MNELSIEACLKIYLIVFLSLCITVYFVLTSFLMLVCDFGICISSVKKVLLCFDAEL